MKRFFAILITLCILCTAVTCLADEEPYTILGNDTYASTTPFGKDFPGNVTYRLSAGSKITVVGEYNGWTVIHYSDEYGVLFVETGVHKSQTMPSPVIAQKDTCVKAVVGSGYSVWVRKAPSKDEKYCDYTIHGGDYVEINGEIVTDEEGTEYYPIRVLKGNDYVQMYVVAKYFDIVIE